MRKKTHEVFGVSNQILPDSYVDRGSLDGRIQALLGRPTHIALRGESKCGKSWIRQQNIPDAITVQCRFNKTVRDIYTDALSQLGIRLNVEDTTSTSKTATAEVSGEVGFKILAKLGFKGTLSGQGAQTAKNVPIGHDIEDFKFIVSIIKESNRRLVIEDFHYLNFKQRKEFAFDLKTLWDYGLFVTIIGVWSQSNMLLYLNPDLSGRVEELPIYWTSDDLRQVIDKGANALNLIVSEQIQNRMADECFGNVGILQKLMLDTLDASGVTQQGNDKIPVENLSALETAAMSYAEQLNPLYLQFAKGVSAGIRKRQDSTGIYAHSMAVILGASDDDLIRGLLLDSIFEAAHARQNRIQKGNLRKVLEKFEELQVDEDGRGLILSYNEATSEIIVVDRQLLLYRKYATVKWPWEDLISDVDQSGGGYDAPADERQPDVSLIGGASP